MPALNAIADKLYDEAQLAITQQGLDCADDPRLAVDFQPIADLERLLAAQMPRCDHLVAAAQLIAIVDPSHRRPGRYAHDATAGERAAAVASVDGDDLPNLVPIPLLEDSRTAPGRPLRTQSAPFPCHAAPRLVRQGSESPVLAGPHFMGGLGSHLLGQRVQRPSACATEGPAVVRDARSSIRMNKRPMARLRRSL